MGDIAILSASQVGTFQQCSLKWRFRYREKAPEEKRSSALVVGSVVDTAVKNGIHMLKSGEVLVERLETERVFDEAWVAELASTSVPIDWGKTGEDALRETALGVTRAFLDAEDLPARADRIEALDVRFELPVLDPRSGQEVPGVRVMGILDAVERTEAGLRPLDFKTSASRAGWDEQSLATHLQGSLYLDALHRLYPDEATGEVAFWIGLKLKTPVLEDRIATITEAARRRAMLTVLKAHDAMQTGIAFPQPSFLCSGCPYQKRCSRWQDAVAPTPIRTVDAFAQSVLEQSGAA